MMRKIVYFIGAGASRAFNPESPLMDDFLKCALENISGSKDEAAARALFKVVQHARGPVSLSRGTVPDVPAKLDGPVVLQKWKQAVAGFLAHPYSSGSQPALQFNIEKQFIAASELWDSPDGDKGEYYALLVKLIGWLFSRLDQKIAQNVWDRSDNPYKLLADFAASEPKSMHTFISYNYDGWLERALYRNLGERGYLWHPATGYSPDGGDGVVGYLGSELRQKIRSGDCSEASSAPVQFFPNERGQYRSLVRVLKPHGSVTWVHAPENRHVFPLVLLDSDGPEGNVAHLEDGEPLNDVQLQGQNISGGKYEPLIIPPAPIKVRYGPIFWNISKTIQQALTNCDTVVVIGWSMPETDQDAMSELSRIVRSRDQQIENLLVCQKNAPRSVFSRFEQVFWPKFAPLSSNEGFNQKFIKSMWDIP